MHYVCVYGWVSVLITSGKYDPCNRNMLILRYIIITSVRNRVKLFLWGGGGGSLSETSSNDAHRYY